MGFPEGSDMKAAREILMYNKDRVYAFVMALGEDSDSPKDQLISDEKYATAAGAINFGFPVISNIPIPEIRPTGICTYEHVISDVKMDEIVSRAIELRGLTIKVEDIPIPVPFGAGFEGERVRKEDMFVQFGGKYTDAFELLRMKSMDEVEDGKIEVIGPEVDDMEEGGAYPLGIVVEVAGREFQEDFESVLERRIHEFISCFGRKTLSRLQREGFLAQASLRGESFTALSTSGLTTFSGQRPLRQSTTWRVVRVRTSSSDSTERNEACGVMITRGSL